MWDAQGKWHNLSPDTTGPYKEERQVLSFLAQFNEDLNGARVDHYPEYYYLPLTYSNHTLADVMMDEFSLEFVRDEVIPRHKAKAHGFLGRCQECGEYSHLKELKHSTELLGVTSDDYWYCDKCLGDTKCDLCETPTLSHKYIHNTPSVEGGPWCLACLETAIEQELLRLEEEFNITSRKRNNLIKKQGKTTEQETAEKYYRILEFINNQYKHLSNTADKILTNAEKKEEQE